MNGELQKFGKAISHKNEHKNGPNLMEHPRLGDALHNFQIRKALSRLNHNLNQMLIRFQEDRP